jgi:hypothetical protein
MNCVTSPLNTPMMSLVVKSVRRSFDLLVGLEHVAADLAAEVDLHLLGVHLVAASCRRSSSSW